MHLLTIGSGLALIAIGTGLGWLLRGLRAGRRPVRPFRSLPSGPSVTAQSDRSTLIGICIDLADRLRDRDSALWNWLNSRLATVGVEPVMADGERFDRDLHQAVDREWTSDQSLAGTVAATDFAGYRTVDGQWIRHPQVVVYRLNDTST